MSQKTKPLFPKTYRVMVGVAHLVVTVSLFGMAVLFYLRGNWFAFFIEVATISVYWMSILKPALDAAEVRE